MPFQNTLTLDFVPGKGCYLTHQFPRYTRIFHTHRIQCFAGHPQGRIRAEKRSHYVGPLRLADLCSGPCVYAVWYGKRNDKRNEKNVVKQEERHYQYGNTHYLLRNIHRQPIVSFVSLQMDHKSVHLLDSDRTAGQDQMEQLRKGKLVE